MLKAHIPVLFSRNLSTGQEFGLEGHLEIHRFYGSVFIPCNDDFYEHYSGSSPYRVHMLDQLHSPWKRLTIRFQNLDDSY